MKMSFRINVWDNVSLFVGSKKVLSSSLERACGIQGLADGAADRCWDGSVVEIPGCPPFPVNEASDRVAIASILYDRLFRGDVFCPGKHLVLVVRSSRDR
jgi:hypothetical protein